jgi:hypothetical protein
MTDWWEVLRIPSLYSLKDCSFYLNSDRLYGNEFGEKYLLYSISLKDESWQKILVHVAGQKQNDINSSNFLCN